MRLERIASAAWEAGPGHRLRLRFADGVEGVADLSDLVAAGGVFASLAARPETLAVAQGGRAVAWADPDGEEADMDADTLRRMIAAAPERAAAE